MPAQPKDLPSVLALARVAENRRKSAFVSFYAKAKEDKFHVNQGNRCNSKFQGKQWKGEDKNPPK